MTERDSKSVIVGRIAGLHGVRGWLKVYSYTEPRDNVLDYGPWRLAKGDTERVLEVDEGKTHGKGLVAHLEGIDDRDMAAALIDADIQVPRDRLPATAPGEYYWCDLIGCQVITTDGQTLGRVKSLLETGANDVLVVDGDRERLVPYVLGQVIRQVDLTHRTIRVDWDADF